MNFQCGPPVEPLKVLIVNSLAPAAQYLAAKILTGEIFGKNQLIDIILMVYANEQSKAIGLKFELENCAFACTNSIEVSSNLPSITDADVFCFITNFPNPNILDFSKMNNERHLDMLDLIVNIANNLNWPEEEKKADETAQKPAKLQKEYVLPKKARKPIFVADGLVAIDILMSLSKKLSCDIFFCPTPIPALAKSVLSGHLKVQCKVLNDVLVWAANDEIFHVEFEKPLIVHDDVGDASSPCHCRSLGKDMVASLNLDHTQFNCSWLKKDLITKTLALTEKNPYGNIYKAAVMAKMLEKICLAREINEKLFTNMGVISDGSLETIKGHPYVLPVVFSGDTWSVNTRFEKDVHLKQEIKRMNKAVKEFHNKLIPFCKEFFHDDVNSLPLRAEEEESQDEQ